MSFAKVIFRRGIAPRKRLYWLSLLITWVIVPPVIRALDAKTELMLFVFDFREMEMLLRRRSWWAGVKEQSCDVVSLYLISYLILNPTMWFVRT
jgi:hypothetical protein